MEAMFFQAVIQNNVIRNRMYPGLPMKAHAGVCYSCHEVIVQILLDRTDLSTMEHGSFSELGPLFTKTLHM